MTTTLYDHDYNQWLLQTLQHLREGQFEAVDWEHLLEEIEDMGKSQKRAIESLLTRLLEHLLKLSYWEAEKERSGRHWAAEIVNFRYQIRKRLQESPSLKPTLETIYSEVLPVAIQSVSKLCDLPPHPDLPLDRILDENWFP
jgi:hypothetical protein